MKEFIRKARIKLNKIGNQKRRAKIKHKEITIIANNCWAGITYQYLGLKFNSPTIGTYFMAEEYIRFLKNFDQCTTGKIEFINSDESKYKEYLIQKKLENMIIGKVNGVEVFFLHYKTKEEAEKKWKKRCLRINKELMIVKFNDQNNCSKDLLQQFETLDFKHKLCFTAKDYDFPSTIWLRKYRNKSYVLDDLYNYHRYFDIIGYINSL